jgi:hypothetical protein
MNSVPGGFWEWLAALDSGERTGLTLMCIVAFVFTVWMVLVTLYKMHKNRMDDALKRELLDRGMSADEIATIIQAGPSAGAASAVNTKMGGIQR